MWCQWVEGAPHVDKGTSAGGRPQGSALSERSERCGMGGDRVADPAGQTRRAQAPGRCAGGAERHLLRAVDRLQWGALPKDLPPKSTVYDYFDLWGWDGTLERVHHALYVACRELAGREASPSAAVIDSQSARAAQKGGPRSTRRVTTRARRSPGASGTSWSIRSA